MPLFEATEVTLEPGVYRGNLKDIEPNTRPQYENPTETEPCFDWTFEVTEPGYEGQTLKSRTSASFGPRSKARAWVQALMGGRKIESGMAFEKADIVGKEVMLSIVHKETDRGTFANISDLIPVRQGASQQQTMAQAERIRERFATGQPAQVQPTPPMDPETEAEINEAPF